MTVLCCCCCCVRRQDAYIDGMALRYLPSLLCKLNNHLKKNNQRPADWGCPDKRRTNVHWWVWCWLNVQNLVYSCRRFVIWGQLANSWRQVQFVFVLEQLIIFPSTSSRGAHVSFCTLCTAQKVTCGPLLLYKCAWANWYNSLFVSLGFVAVDLMKDEFNSTLLKEIILLEELHTQLSSEQSLACGWLCVCGFRAIGTPQTPIYTQSIQFKCSFISMKNVCATCWPQMLINSSNVLQSLINEQFNNQKA